MLNEILKESDVSDLLRPSRNLAPGTVAQEQHERARRGQLNGPVRRYPPAFRVLLNGLIRYADAHQAQYGTPLGEDYVLGPAWGRIAAGILELLNGETGGLDCGSIDSNVREYARYIGLDSDRLGEA